MTEHFIPTNFEIPDGYKRTFTFKDGDFAYVIAVTKQGIQTRESGHCVNQSLCLDWIQESIEFVRKELE